MRSQEPGQFSELQIRSLCHFDGSIHRSASHGEHIVSPTRNLPLQRKQLKIEDPLGEPDERDGDHRQ
jgi:hypothetical protein